METKAQRDSCAQCTDKSQELAKNCEAVISFKKRKSTPKTPVTTAPNPGKSGHPHSGSSEVNAKKLKMGGLVEGHCRKEAWTR